VRIEHAVDVVLFVGIVFWGRVIMHCFGFDSAASWMVLIPNLEMIL
jgi:hypothetical protein